MVDDLFCNIAKPAPVIRAGSPVKVSNGPFRAPTRFVPNVVALSAPTPSGVSAEFAMTNRPFHNAPKNGDGDGRCRYPGRISL
jgi:hypothetical protein